MKKKLTLIIAAAMCFLLLAACAKAEGSGTTDPTKNADTDSADPGEALDGKNKTFTVIIDPGHGFGDPGSQPKYLKEDESAVALRAAGQLKDELEGMGISVIMTHDGVSFPSSDEILSAADKYGIEYKPENIIDNDVFSAYERVIYTNVLSHQYENCFFVSLHTNSIEDSPSTKGLALDYYAGSPFAGVLADFAKSFRLRVLDEFDKDTVIFADTYDEAYIVNKYCLAPSVLIEMGYGSNSDDGADLSSSQWTKKFSKVLAEIINDYKTRFE